MAFLQLLLTCNSKSHLFSFYANATNSTKEMEVKLNDDFNPDLSEHLSALLWNSSVYKNNKQTFHSLRRAKIIQKLMGTKTVIKKKVILKSVTLYFNLFKKISRA